jgi:hypothetical protein
VPAEAERAAKASNTFGPTAIEPYTVNAAPRVFERNVRRSRPVPAGTGMPFSMDGNPRPASAIPWRSCEDRENSRQW